MHRTLPLCITHQFWEINNKKWCSPRATLGGRYRRLHTCYVDCILMCCVGEISCCATNTCATCVVVMLKELNYHYDNLKQFKVCTASPEKKNLSWLFDSFLLTSIFNHSYTNTAAAQLVQTTMWFMGLHQIFIFSIREQWSRSPPLCIWLNAADM